MNPSGRRPGFWSKAALAALVLLAVANLFPVYWITVTAFKARSEMITFPPVWFPHAPTLANFRETFVTRDFTSYLFNSVLAAVLSTLLCMIAGTFAGYSLARFSFPGSFQEGVSFWILSTRMFPPIVTVIPIYFLMRSLSLLDTRAALVISYTLFNLPLVVWMMRGVFQEIPHDLEEAAMVDGLSRGAAMLKITLPLSAPGLASTAILCMILSFNEFLLALTMGTVKAVTLPVGIAGCVTQYKVMWGEMSAAGLVAVVPIVLFILVAQKYLVSGLTMGAVKG